ncbi:hypothetical protein CABS01_05604 [Colletotrichum abscissum]|uniref:uncharacterized protein n=1 Tax=Colletotrichum abscissum TaxID=1671311 RepID=UPI0027D52D5F|nr:uncharacterized protein CABS01_05604 [Colletotrichum abscissum]KAK1521099.1 hypothetical protein CABS01_05604 [Colletotrichum abscissum]
MATGPTANWNFGLRFLAADFLGCVGGDDEALSMCKMVSQRWSSTSHRTLAVVLRRKFVLPYEIQEHKSPRSFASLLPPSTSVVSCALPAARHETTAAAGGASHITAWHGTRGCPACRGALGPVEHERKSARKWYSARSQPLLIPHYCRPRDWLFTTGFKKIALASGPAHRISAG